MIVFRMKEGQHGKEDVGGMTRGWYWGDIPACKGCHCSIAVRIPIPHPTSCPDNTKGPKGAENDLSLTPHWPVMCEELREKWGIVQDRR